jgi:hypothetical protein
VARSRLSSLVDGGQFIGTTISAPRHATAFRRIPMETGLAAVFRTEPTESPLTRTVKPSCRRYELKSIGVGYIDIQALGAI